MKSSLIASYLKSVFYLIGALIIVSGATLFFAPVQVFADISQLDSSDHETGNFIWNVNIPGFSTGESGANLFWLGSGLVGSVDTLSMASDAGLCTYPTHNTSYTVHLMEFSANDQSTFTGKRANWGFTSTTNDKGFYTDNTVSLVGGWDGVFDPAKYYAFSIVSGASQCAYFWGVDSGGFVPYYVFSGDGVEGGFNINTRIVDVTPADGAELPSGVPVSFGMHAYINEEDIGSVLNIAFSLHNIDQNVLLLSDLSPNDIDFLDQVLATSSGHFYYSTTTVIADGNYRIEASMERVYFHLISNPFSPVNQDVSHQFIVGSSTYIGNISQNSFSQFNDLFASTSATSTLAQANSCNVLSLFNMFDPIKCVTFLFIPDAGYLYDTLVNFKDNVASHFPLGYLTDFILILTDDEVGSLTVIDATLPGALKSGSPHIRLDLTHGLDTYLNATTSEFTNSSASSTDTLYTFTNRYWEKIVYILTGFYLLTRIFGSGVIPKFGFRV